MKFEPSGFQNFRLLTHKNLCIYEVDPDRFLQLFVSMDKSWVHHFQPVLKQQSKTVEPYVISSPPKDMASVFWDAECIITEDLPKGRMITGA